MQFNALGKKSGTVTKKSELPENLAVRITSIEVGSNDRPGMFHGINVATEEPISVRMTTIDEGAKMNIRKGENFESCVARITSIYRGSGEKHRPRVAEFNDPNHKVYCETGGMMFFTKCLKNEDGTYRAHWAETMDSRPGARCDRVMGQIRVENIYDKSTSKVTGVNVVADCVHLESATILNRENTMNTLMTAFQNVSGENEIRKPFIYVRLIDAQNGQIVLSPIKASAAYQKVTRKDPDLGTEEVSYRTADPRESIKNLMSPENNTSDSSLILRAALHGFAKEPEKNPYPDFGVIDDAKKGELKQITDAVRAGNLLIEVIPGERYAAGPATRASIIKQVNNSEQHPFNFAFKKVNDKGHVEDRMFTHVYLTTRVGKDGYRLFTKCQIEQVYPKSQTVANLATVNDLSAMQTRAKERAAEASSDSVEIPDDMPFDAAALDVEQSDVNAQLAAAATTVNESSFEFS